MTHSLVNRTATFLKIAQQQKEKSIRLDPNKPSANVKFYSQFLYKAVREMGNFLPSQARAKQVFDAIAKHNEQPSHLESPELKQVEMILAAIETAEQNLQRANVNPIEALKKMGATNVNPNILNILKANLKALRDAQNFGAYTHYQLPSHGPEVIELDNYVPPSEAGY